MEKIDLQATVDLKPLQFSKKVEDSIINATINFGRLCTIAEKFEKVMRYSIIVVTFSIFFLSFSSAYVQISIYVHKSNIRLKYFR
jgi:hypothetical protein